MFILLSLNYSTTRQPLLRSYRKVVQLRLSVMSLFPAAIAASLTAAGAKLYETTKRHLRKDETAVQLALIDARILEDQSYWENWFLDHPKIPRHIPQQRPLRLLSLGQ